MSGEAERWYRLGLDRLDEGRPGDAEPCFRRALAEDPRHAKASVNLGVALEMAGRYEEAVPCYRQALESDPGLAQAWFNLGALLLWRGRHDEAAEVLRRAVQLDPAQPNWRVALGSALRGAGDPEGAVASFDEALRLDPAVPGAHSERLLSMNAIAALDPERLSAAHLAWGRAQPAPVPAAFPNARDPRRRLKLGYVAADFRDPAIGACLQPVLAWHDRAEFDVCCYSDAVAEDDFTWKLRTRAVRWHATAGWSNGELAAQIRADGIDLLVDLSGHAAGGRRLPVFAGRAAPVQAAWLGYPATTGLAAIDYRITDTAACPEGEERYWSETPVRLPFSAVCFKPSDGDAAAGEGMTLGAIHASALMTAPSLALWARVLRELPESKLLLAAPGGEAQARRIGQHFRDAGIAADRIECAPADGPADWQALRARTHIALDAVPGGSVSAALQSLAMGIPVVALEGRTPASRAVAGALRSAGLAGQVAASADAYVAIARALAADRARLASMRRDLRAALAASPLADAERFTRTLESAFRRLWQGWCERAAPAPLRIEAAAPRPAVRAQPAPPVPPARPSVPRVIVDGIFFQYLDTGIARVWRSVLQAWAASGFARQVLLLDRCNSAPRIDGIERREVPAHSLERLEEDRSMLQQVCDEERASVFVSTNYTAPLATPAAMLVYDMIPELLGADLEAPVWREKDACIRHARRFACISRNTARDLCDLYPWIDPARVSVAHCGVDPVFRPAAAGAVDAFRARHGIRKPYFLLVGARWAYKNVDVFFRAFAALPDRGRYAVVCVGGEAELAPAQLAAIEGCERHLLRLDDADLALAYAGALALVYPSMYEGFGMPVAEAMACGCPVLTTPNASLPEVAGGAALYAKPQDDAAWSAALLRVQAPELRARLAALGVERARRYSWPGMAEEIARILGEIR